MQRSIRAFLKCHNTSWKSRDLLKWQLPASRANTQKKSESETSESVLINNSIKMLCNRKKCAFKLVPKSAFALVATRCLLGVTSWPSDWLWSLRQLCMMSSDTLYPHDVSMSCLSNHVQTCQTLSQSLN